MGSTAECHLQLLEHKVYSFARLCPERTFLSFCHRCHVAALFMSYKVNSNLNQCLFSELPSSSDRVRYTRPEAAAHPLQFEVSRCRTYKFSRCFLPAQTRVWNYLRHAVIDTGTLDRFKRVANRRLLPGVCFSVFRDAGACGDA